MSETLIIILIVCSFLGALIIHILSVKEERNYKADDKAQEIYSLFKEKYTSRITVGYPLILGEEENYIVYGVNSVPSEQSRGGGLWNYYKYYQDGKIEEFEVKPKDKYWKATGK